MAAIGVEPQKVCEVLVVANTIEFARHAREEEIRHGHVDVFAAHDGRVGAVDIVERGRIGDFGHEVEDVDREDAGDVIANVINVVDGTLALLGRSGCAAIALAEGGVDHQRAEHEEQDRATAVAGQGGLAEKTLNWCEHVAHSVSFWGGPTRPRCRLLSVGVFLPGMGSIALPAESVRSPRHRGYRSRTGRSLPWTDRLGLRRTW